MVRNGNALRDTCQARWRMLKCHATVGRLADGIALEVDCQEGKVAL